MSDMEDTLLQEKASQDPLMKEEESGPQKRERLKKEWKASRDGKEWARKTRRGLIIGDYVSREGELPADLRNSIVKKSKKDALGQLQLRKFTGVERTKTAKVIRKFERELTGGKDDIIEKLEAVEGEGNLTKAQFAILEQLRHKPNITLERAIVEAGANPLAVMDGYARGCVVLSKMQALIVAHQGLPAVVRDLFRHAIDGTSICDVCVGAGKVTIRAGSTQLGPDCPRCRGIGTVYASPSELKEFAVQKILEVTKMTEKAGQNINIQTNVGVKVGTGGTVLDKLSVMADEILYGKKETPIEAEVVEEKLER